MTAAELAVPLPPVTCRPIHATDIGALRRMFDRCSRRTVYRRFFCAYPAAVPDRVLRRMTFVDSVTRHAAVAVVRDEVVGIVSFDKVGAGDEAEFAICVEDDWQRRGVGRELLEWMIESARGRGVLTLRADIQADNRPALALLRAVLPDAQLRLDATTYAVLAAL